MTGFIDFDATTLDPGVCRCSRCAAPAAPRAPLAALPARHRPRLRLAATGALVAVGGTALALTATSPAGAETAPSHAGWDGHRYWFQRNGEWRWTSHYDIYLQNTSRAGSGSGSGSGSTAKTVSSGGLHQGWDGHRYWFQRNGEWRWTSHYDVYLSYTSRAGSGSGGGSGSSASGSVAKTVSSGGLRQGWDGHRYWFQRNGEWRWTSHYDVYVRYTSGSGNPAPPKATTSSLDAALAFAEAQLGKPYVWGGNGPNGYDCSGLVQQAFLRAGLHLPRVAVDQYRAARPIAAADLRAGDLLFWSSSSRVTGIHHVAVYLGGGRYIEAPRPGVHVRISILSTGYYPTFFGRVTG